MKKKLFILLSALLTVTLCACSGSNKPTVSVTSEKTPATTVQNTAATEPKSALSMLIAVKASQTELEDMTTITPADDEYDDNFEYLFSLSSNIAAHSAVSFCTNGNKADEIDIFILNNENDSAKLKSALEKRVQARIRVYKGYSDAEVEKLENSVILINGKYAALIVCPDPESAKKAFENAIKK